MYFNKNIDTDINKEFKNNTLTPNIKKTVLIIIPIIFIILVSTIFILKKDNNKNNTNYLFLEGNEIITLYQGNDYIEPGYKAHNSQNEDLTNKIKINSNLNTKVIGEYEITYTIGNITKKRIIKVIEKPKVHTFIRLNTIDNNVHIYIKLGETYKEPGYQVFSSTGENLNNKVKITGTIDTSKKGTYTLTYSLVDQNGVTISATRTITVMNTEINLSLNTKEYTNKDVEIKINIEDNLFDYLLLPDNTKVKEKSYIYKVSSNGKYTFKTYNTKGIEEEASIEVTNIDKIAPTGTCNGYYKNGKTTININATDNIEINKYIINNKEYYTKNITLYESIKNANIAIYDKAGNKKEISCQLENKNSKLEIHFIASGAYDDAILIRTNDKTILIDSGQWACRKNVTPYLKTIGVTKIDAMLGSHLHFNHIQAQADILANFSVDKIYYPDDIFTCAKRKSCNEEDQNHILNEIKKQNKTPIITTPGQKITIDEIELYFLGPEKIVTGGSYPQNYNSSIMILKFYNNTFMFTGDAVGNTLNITNIEKYANNLGIKLDVDLLKYPHHGNANLPDKFLQTIKPEYTIVPNYKASHFPSSTNINKFKQYNVNMYRQSDSKTGNILITSDGTNIKIYNDVTAENYHNYK